MGDGITYDGSAIAAIVGAGYVTAPAVSIMMHGRRRHPRSLLAAFRGKLIGTALGCVIMSTASNTWSRTR